MSRGPKLCLILLISLSSIYFLLRLSGYDPLWHLVPSWDQSLQSGNLKLALQAGTARQRPYIIESVMALIDVEDLPREKPLQRTTTFRYIYTIRPLRKITASENSFTESLHNHFGKRLDYFQGSDMQQPLALKSDQITFNVTFNADKGDVYTVVTGMRILEDLPLKERSIRGIHFNPNEYAAIYPNDEDFIAQATLMLTSATTHLKITKDAAWRKPSPDTAPVFTAANSYQDGVESYNTTLCARFSNLKPGEIIGLNYYW